MYPSHLVINTTEPNSLQLRLGTDDWNPFWEKIQISREKLLNQMVGKKLYYTKMAARFYKQWRHFVIQMYVLLRSRQWRLANKRCNICHLFRRHSIGQPLTTCQKEYQKHLRRWGKSFSRYVPRCSPDGSYEEVQCATGVCNCVTPQGKEIPGTKIFNSARQPNCTHPGNLWIKLRTRNASCFDVYIVIAYCYLLPMNGIL